MNLLLLSGFVGTTERRRTPKGTPYLVFSLATTRRVRAPHAGWESVTDWHACLIRGSFGDSAARHITPDTAVDLQGTLEYRPQQGGTARAIVVVTSWELRRRPQLPQPEDLLDFVDAGEVAASEVVS